MKNGSRNDYTRLCFIACIVRYTDSLVFIHHPVTTAAAAALLPSSRWSIQKVSSEEELRMFSSSKDKQPFDWPCSHILHYTIIFHAIIMQIMKAETWTDPKKHQGQTGPHYFVHYKGWKQTWVVAKTWRQCRTRMYQKQQRIRADYISSLFLFRVLLSSFLMYRSYLSFNVHSLKPLGIALCNNSPAGTNGYLKHVFWNGKIRI